MVYLVLMQHWNISIKTSTWQAWKKQVGEKLHFSTDFFISFFCSQ